MPNHHRKRKKTFRITTGVKTGIYLLLGLIVFFILLFQVWDCQF
jgi:hypothetical protein